MWSHLWVQSQIWRLTLWLLCCMQHCVIPEFMTGGFYDDVIKWKYFPRFCPFVRGIPRSPANSPHKGQWNGALMFSLICAWIDTWVNNGEAGDSRRHWCVIVMPPVDFIHGNAFCTALLALCEGNPMVNNWFTKNPATFEPQYVFEQTFELPVIRNAMALMRRHCNCIKWNNISSPPLLLVRGVWYEPLASSLFDNSDTAGA